MGKRRLQDENPERAGEVDPTKPQFNPLIPPLPKPDIPSPLEEGVEQFWKTIEDCKPLFVNVKPFTGHPFIPPTPAMLIAR